MKLKIIVTKEFGGLWPFKSDRTRHILTSQKEVDIRGEEEIIKDNTGWTPPYEFTTVLHQQKEEFESTPTPIKKTQK